MSDGSGDRPDTGPPKVISIDKSGLVQTEYHNHGHQPHKENETAMARHIKSLIRVWFLPFFLSFVQADSHTYAMIFLA